MTHRAAVAAVLALALGGGAIPASAQDAGPGVTPTITVEGEASRDVAPDLAIVSIGVSATRASAQEAAQQTSKIARAMIDAARADGIADADIASVDTSVLPVYDSPKDGTAPRVRAYESTNRLSIKMHKLDATGPLIGHLLDQGANDLGGIDFTVADPEPLLDTVRAEAVRRARHQAEIYAAAAGQRLGRVITIRPEAAPVVFNRVLKAAAPAASAGPVVLAAGTQKLEARVSVTWELQVGQP